MTEHQILSTLDNYKTGYYCHFIDLGQPYSYLIDCRLNVFRDNSDNWAIVGERLGFSPRGGRIELELSYFGNCLINLESYNGQNTNHYTVYPFDEDNFDSAFDSTGLIKHAVACRVRGQQVAITHHKQDYLNAGITLREYEPDEISLDEFGRWLIKDHPDFLRATDAELYKSIPETLNKIVVLDEWYHRDFNEIPRMEMTDAHLQLTYEFNKGLSNDPGYMDYETFYALFRQQEQTTDNHNSDQRQSNRPSSYETWQLLAKVIVTGDPTLYLPTLAPNTHWKNWPDSGSL